MYVTMRGWIDLAQEIDRWRALLIAVNEPSIFKKCGEFLDWLKTGLVSQEDSAS
jgi:hypothetical protein